MKIAERSGADSLQFSMRSLAQLVFVCCGLCFACSAQAESQGKLTSPRAPMVTPLQPALQLSFKLSSQPQPAKKESGLSVKDLTYRYLLTRVPQKLSAGTSNLSNVPRVRLVRGTKILSEFPFPVYSEHERPSALVRQFGLVIPAPASQVDSIQIVSGDQILSEVKIKEKSLCLWEKNPEAACVLGKSDEVCVSSLKACDPDCVDSSKKDYQGRFLSAACAPKGKSGSSTSITW